MRAIPVGCLRSWSDLPDLPDPRCDGCYSRRKRTAVRKLIQYRAFIISHLSAISLFLGFHTLGLYVHNDVMQGFGTPEFGISSSFSA